jgi:uncharacterized protein YceK
MRSTRMVLVICVGAVLSGCATIVGGGSRQPVTVESTPAAASFTIQSSSGLQMAQATTPSTVSLPRKNEYQVQITMPGYQPQSAVLTRGTNGWIWGNLLFGWIVGFGVDFATGSAYKLEPSLVQVSLHQADDGMYAVIHVYNADKKLLDEKRLLMVPDSAAR